MGGGGLSGLATELYLVFFWGGGSSQLKLIYLHKHLVLIVGKWANKFQKSICKRKYKQHQGCIKIINKIQQSYLFRLEDREYIILMYI